jgi:hypothetical protein
MAAKAIPFQHLFSYFCLSDSASPVLGTMVCLHTTVVVVVCNIIIYSFHLVLFSPLDMFVFVANSNIQYLKFYYLINHFFSYRCYFEY